MTLASCGSTGSIEKTKPAPKSKEYFPESVYGVKASPRVVEGKVIPKGGGRNQIGKPYKVKGKWYTPREEFGYKKTGMSSWYGAAFHGRLTANGEIYDKYHLSAAHPTFPLPSYARVTNLENGTSVIVRVNDRGPYEYGRLIDVSSKAADFLDMKRKGTAKVQVQYIGRAPLHGNDMPYLMASYVKKGDRSPSVNPEGQIASGVMVASNEPMQKSLQQSGALPARSMLDTGVPVNALEETASASGAAQSFDAFFDLPVTGPVPMERPELLPVQPGTAFASAYSEIRVQATATPFDRILTSHRPLTEEMIRAYARKQEL